MSLKNKCGTVSDLYNGFNTVKGRNTLRIIFETVKYLKKEKNNKNKSKPRF